MITKAVRYTKEAMGVSPGISSLSARMAQAMLLQVMRDLSFDEDTAIAQLRLSHVSDVLEVTSALKSLSGCSFFMDKCLEISRAIKNGYNGRSLDRTAIKTLFVISGRVNTADYKDIISKNRRRNNCEARFMVWEYLNDRPFRISLVRLGQMAGNRNHSTVLNGLRKHKNYMETDKGYSRRFMLFLEEANKYLGIE